MVTMPKSVQQSCSTLTDAAVDEAAYSKLCRELDSSALIAGFKSESPRSPNPGLAKESRLWTSAFAVILLTPAEPASSAGLHETWKSSGAWLDGLLVDFESKGQNLDGYAVFALPQKPDEELALAVRQMELDTTVCRKHVFGQKRTGRGNRGCVPSRRLVYRRGAARPRNGKLRSCRRGRMRPSNLILQNRTTNTQRQIS